VPSESSDFLLDSPVSFAEAAELVRAEVNLPDTVGNLFEAHYSPTLTTLTFTQ
jgi:hypothetical protein